MILSETEIEKQKEYMDRVKGLNSIFQNKKYFLHTFGCQMNENDSEKIAGMLRDMGYEATDTAAGCDLIIFNTCCVRENAEEKVYGHLGALKKMHEDNPDLIIAVCGCMMQQKTVQDEIRRKYRHVDLVFGTHNLYKLPELLFDVIESRKNIIDVWDSAGSIVEGLPIERESTVKAWVTIMYGCDNFCTYCIVPYVRGRERSRTPSDIVREIEFLVSGGVKEVTLLGQNVNSYNGGGLLFPDLLKLINNIEGLERVRFMTSHPKDISLDLIKAIKELDKVCKQLHLPVQSGSSRVLKEMNRKYTKEHYLDLINIVKNEVPEITLSTDIIVGFPGETEADFLDTLDVVERSCFDMAYTFIYSKRTGTPAALYEKQVPEDVVKERFDRLVELQTVISRRLNEPLLNAEVAVLCEGVSKSNPDRLTGRTDGNKIVNFAMPACGDELKGKMVVVKIESVGTWSLDGSVVQVLG